jgi:hypothetical protein
VCGYDFPADLRTSNLDVSSLQFGAQLEFLDIVGLKLGSRLLPNAEASIDSTEAVRADPRAPRAFRVSQYVEDIQGASALRNGSLFFPIFTKTPAGKGKIG